MRRTRKRKRHTTNNLGALALFLGILSHAHAVQSPDADESALIEYYRNSARESFQRLDIRRQKTSFELLIIIRRYTLSSDVDTLSLDTAVVKAVFRTPAGTDLIPDTLRPDTTIVLRSSFLDERPRLPALFFPPPWQGAFSYALYPNDPGEGAIALAFSAAESPKTDTRLRSDGFFVLDRSTGRLTYLLTYQEQEGGGVRTIECVFGGDQGALIPRRTTEHFTERSMWGSRYLIVETEIIETSIK
ncbi:MAG: hypothetical protein ACE5GA_05890 [Candidatus Zixiibacteriota bacterium]